MLTSDLVRARRKDGRIVPLYLSAETRARVAPVAQEIVATVSAMVGATRDEVDAALDDIDVSARDRSIILGLRKLCEDRCDFAVTEGVSPEEIRRDVFAAAAEAHRSLDLVGTFDREAVLAEVAARTQTTPEALMAGLYADLRGSEVLQRFRALDADELLDRYNLALAQAAVQKATKVVVRIEGEAPARMRDIFRSARFHGLMHTVEGDPKKGYTLVLDGPFSLFGAATRYGLRLALFLPSLLACKAWHLRADVLWGKSREPSTFELGPKDALVGRDAEAPALTPELQAFCAAFNKLESGWTVRASDRIFALPGEAVCIPDLRFKHKERGEEVYLEAFGFWSRAAVWSRVEMLRKGFPVRLLLAVGKQLRVSEEVLGEDDAGEVIVYRANLSPRGVLARLEEKGARKGA